MAFSKARCFALFLLLTAAAPGAVAETECFGDDTCNVAEMPQAVKASAMIQLKAKKDSGCAPQKMEAAHLAESSACVSAELQEAHLQALRYHAASLAQGTANISKQQDDLVWTGKTAPLDADGFFYITSLCCPAHMDDFFMRLLEERGLEPCKEYQLPDLLTYPHIQGLMQWISCSPGMDFNLILSYIDNGTPCKYWTPKGTACPALTPECNKYWCR